jgi:hypothetical protein
LVWSGNGRAAILFNNRDGHPMLNPLSMPIAEPGTVIVKMASLTAELTADLRAAGPASRPHRSEVSKHTLSPLGAMGPGTAQLLNGKIKPAIAGLVQNVILGGGECRALPAMRKGTVLSAPEFQTIWLRN